jgi:hypothetical protein
MNEVGTDQLKAYLIEKGEHLKPLSLSVWLFLSMPILE